MSHSEEVMAVHTVDFVDSEKVLWQYRCTMEVFPVVTSPTMITFIILSFETRDMIPQLVFLFFHSRQTKEEKKRKKKEGERLAHYVTQTPSSFAPSPSKDL